jgi:hypothetical protein
LERGSFAFICNLIFLRHSGLRRNDVTDTLWTFWFFQY